MQIHSLPLTLLTMEVIVTYSQVKEAKAWLVDDCDGNHYHLETDILAMAQQRSLEG